MKPRDFVLLSVLTLTVMAGDAQHGVKAVQTSPDIERTVREYAKKRSPYRKFRDKSVCYLGKVLYARENIIRESRDTTNIIIIRYGFKVHDVQEDGCRIDSLDSRGDPIGRDMFVERLSGVFSDREYRGLLILKPLGSYTYKTVAGGSRTIPRFDFGEDATRDEFIAYLERLREGR